MSRDRLPAWTPFEQVDFAPSEASVSRYMDFYGVSHEEALAALSKDVFQNSRYQVSRVTAPSPENCNGAFVQLSIQRLDGEPVGPERYRDFMRIKDELVGHEHEAVEIYPRRSQEIDAANTYHLWVEVTGRRPFAFGFRAGRWVFRESPRSGRKQRPFDPDDYEMVSGVHEMPHALVTRRTT